MKTQAADPKETRIPSETRSPVTGSRRTEFRLLLERRLAAALDLQEQLRQGHLTLLGHNFDELHELFEKISGVIETYTDSISASLLKLDGMGTRAARGKMSFSQLGEASLAIPENVPTIDKVLKAILKAHSTLGEEARESTHEADQPDSEATAGIFTEVSQGVDKWLWFVETHIQAKTDKR